MADGLEHHSYLARNCWIDLEVESANRSICARIRVCGSVAALQTEAEVRWFIFKHATFRCSWSTVYEDGTGWVALLAGLHARPKPRRIEREWTEGELEALWQVYRERGLAGCVEQFPERSVSSMRGALKRYKRRARDAVAVS
jgi:hypothetical protein